MCTYRRDEPGHNGQDTNRAVSRHRDGDPGQHVAALHQGHGVGMFGGRNRVQDPRHLSRIRGRHLLHAQDEIALLDAAVRGGTGRINQRDGDTRRAGGRGGEFQAKMALLVLAGCNMVIFHLIGTREIARWGAAARTPVAAKAAVLRDYHAAEDCAQESFVRAYRSWKDWKPDAPAEAFPACMLAMIALTVIS